MERDFMGLNFKDSVVVVKEETVEGCKDSVLSTGLQVQWPLPNTFNTSNICHLGENKNAYPGSTQEVSLSMNNHSSKAQFTGAGQNFTAAPTKPHFLGGLSITGPHQIHPSIGSMAGATDSWFNLNTSGAPAQLTIFYGDTVNVFDDISPEKAHAIMLLAGNGFPAGSNVGQPRHQFQAPSSKPVVEDVGLLNQPKNTPPCSGQSSPVSVSSHPVGKSGVDSINSDAPRKTNGISTTCTTKVEAPKLITSHGSPMIQLAVPQARNASLARFLAKRKERVMSSAPYSNLIKKSAEFSTPKSNSISFSGTSALGLPSISTGKDSDQ